MTTHARCLPLAIAIAACSPMQPAPVSPPLPSPTATVASPTTTPLPPAPADDALPLDPVRLAYTPSELRPSGATLRHVLVPTVPLVHLRIVFPAGWRADGPQPGITALTAWTLVEGAVGPDAPTGRTYGIERVTDLSAEVTPSATIFSATVLSQDLDEAVEHLQKMIHIPGFRASAFQRAQGTVVRQPATTQRAEQAALFDLPAITPTELERSVSRLEPWHCRAFHKASYRSDGAVVAWVGDVTADRARALTDRLFAGWKPSKTSSKTEPRPLGQGNAIAPSTEERVKVVLLARGPSLEHEDWPALWVVAKALGSECSPLPWNTVPAAFRVCKTLPASQAEAWVGETRRRLDDMAAQGLAPSVLETAKRGIVDEESRRLSDPEAIADTLARWDASLVDGVGDRVRPVTDVREAVSRHLRAEEVRVVVVQKE
jgi:hypothetical protein